MIFCRKAMYLVIYSYEGVKIPDLLLGCSYNYVDNMIDFHCRTRKRSLLLKEIVKNSDREFEFVDINGVIVHFHPVSVKDYIKYKDYLFANISYMNVILSQIKLSISYRRGGIFCETIHA